MCVAFIGYIQNGDTQMKKLITAAVVALSFTGTAVADPISWNDTWGNSATNLINEFVFAYNSQSLVSDTNGNNLLDAGDTIVSAGGFGSAGFDSLLTPLSGLGFDSINSNQVTGFSPNPFPAMVGYGTDYLFTFSFKNLVGQYNGTDFVYNTGAINFGVFSALTANGLTAGFNSLFNIDLSYGGPDNSLGQQKQIFNGLVNTPTNGAGSAFSINHLGSNKTLNEWLALGDVRMNSNQTVSGGIGGFNATNVTFVNGVGILAANHTGRMSINVPEPTSIAILGLGLLGFVGSRRRKS